MTPGTKIQLLWSLVGVLAVAPTSFCQSTNGPTPVNRRNFAARYYVQNTPFAGEITRGIAVAETNQFSFVIPGGFRQQIDPVGKSISLVSTNFECAIVTKIHESALEGPTDISVDSVRQLLASHYKNAKIVDEFRASVESMTGPAFEIEWNSEGIKMSTRAAFVPYPGGHLEITVQAPATKFRNYDQALFQFLLSIRTSPIGAKLAVQEFLSEL